MFKVCFDVDGTLFDYKDGVRKNILDLLNAFRNIPDVEVYVWSGGGVKYAKQRLRGLGIENVVVISKGSIKPDLAIDDQTVSLGIVNLRSNPLTEYE